MVYTDPMTTLITLLNTITITPESITSISKNVSIGNVNATLRGGVGGEITPQFTVMKQAAPTRAMDGAGATSTVEFNYIVSCWNQTYGPTENSAKLNEKMVKAVRDLIKTNRKNPSGTIRYLEVINEIQRDEADITPIIRRTMIFVRAVCLRE